MRLFKTTLLFLILFAVQPLRAQIDSLVYGVQPLAIDTAAKGELRVSIEAMPFLRDNEYKSKLVKGYTLPGIWLDPMVSYQPLRNLKIDLGAHLLHFWGAHKYPNFNYSGLAGWQGKSTQDGFHAVPIFRVQMQLAHNLNVLVGTLHGKSNHGLITPLYNDELNLSADPETGVQVLWHTRPFTLDAWVNWESFIFHNDKGQESFSFGLSTRFRPSRSSARVQCYLPLQAVFQHRGGEINPEAPDRMVKTWFNAAAGVGVDIPLATRLPATLNFEADAAYFGQQAGTLLPFNSGYGLFLQASARVWRCKLSLGYWHCNDFVSIFGNPLYGTLSLAHEGLTFSKPHNLTAHLEYAQQLGKGFAWGIHADVLNQFAAKSYSPTEGLQRQPSSLNFAAGIYVRVFPSFLIKKF